MAAALLVPAVGREALKVTALDGAIRVIEPGKIWLMTDTKGRGHESAVVSQEPFDAALVFLPSPG